MRKFVFSGLILTAMALVSGPAFADSIGGPTNINCDASNCLGVLYTLTYNPTPISTTSTTSTYLVNLTMDTSGINNGATLLQDVAFKVVSGNSSQYGTVTLTDAPTGVSNWTTVVGGESVNGCSKGNAGFVCSQTTSFGKDLAVGPGDIYSWTWDVQVANGSLTTGPFAAHVKNSFGIVDPKKGGFKQHGQPSAAITLQPVTTTTATPEPASLLLIGTGIAGIAGKLRRRFGK